MQGRGWAAATEVAHRACSCWPRPCRPGRDYAVRTFAQARASNSRNRQFTQSLGLSLLSLVSARTLADRRMVRLTVAGPPDGQPPRVIEVDDPLSAPAELISSNDNVHIQKAGITKSEAREQAAIIQAQREEIGTLRKALAETQDVMFKGKSALNEVVQTKDLQIAQLYELAASGVRERAKLRQELSEIQSEMQGTKRQLHAFMNSLMQLKSSMDSAGDGDIEHALELLQSSSWTQSLQGSNLGPPLSNDDDVYLQLVQMQKLSDTLVQDMKQDEELMQQGLDPRSRPSSTSSIDASIDKLPSSSTSRAIVVAPRSSSPATSSSTSKATTSASKSSSPAATSSSTSKGDSVSSNSHKAPAAAAAPAAAPAALPPAKVPAASNTTTSSSSSGSSTKDSSGTPKTNSTWGSSGGSSSSTKDNTSTKDSSITKDSNTTKDSSSTSKSSSTGGSSSNVVPKDGGGWGATKAPNNGNSSGSSTSGNSSNGRSIFPRWP